MRTFILRARKTSSEPGKIITQTGTEGHAENIAHTLIHSFYLSKSMRDDVEVYLVFDSAKDFPKTLFFRSHPELSFKGFHEKAMLDVVAHALSLGKAVKKDQILSVLPGICMLGLGFDKLIQDLQNSRPIYLLDKKGSDIRKSPLKNNPVFILSDHIPMPKNSLKCIEKRGAEKISLGPNMLFAAHCVVLIHNELDRG